MELLFFLPSSVKNSAQPPTTLAQFQSEWWVGVIYLGFGLLGLIWFFTVGQREFFEAVPVQDDLLTGIQEPDMSPTPSDEPSNSPRSSKLVETVDAESASITHSPSEQ